VFVGSKRFLCNFILFILGSFDNSFSHGLNAMKLFTTAIYEARVFVPDRPFQRSLKFVGKARGLT
jgi:hypothetical protein